MQREWYADNSSHEKLSAPLRQHADRVAQSGGRQLAAGRRLVQRRNVRRLRELDRLARCGILKERDRHTGETVLHLDVIVAEDRLALARRQHEIAAARAERDRGRLVARSEFAA